MDAYIEFLTERVDWAAWATFLVVLVALYPIHRERQVAKTRARNLRIRFGDRLLRLRPTLALAGGHPGVDRNTTLSGDEFREITHEIDGMMANTAVLEADELDQLGMTFLNLRLLGQQFGSPSIGFDPPNNALELIDETIKLFESHGLTKTKLRKPWK